MFSSPLRQWARLASARRVLSRASSKLWAPSVPRVLLALSPARLPACCWLVPVLAQRYSDPSPKPPYYPTITQSKGLTQHQLELADEIVATLGNDPQVIAGAAALVAAEKNFNPFAVDIPTICSNAALPATPELRGIIPLVDPAVDGADVQNANSAASLAAPFADNGLSVADISRAQGFENFDEQA